MPPTNAAARTTTSGRSFSKKEATLFWSVKSSSECVLPIRL